MLHAHDRLIVVTGGPGAGKTTLIETLRERGYPVCPEAGRAIIQHQTAIGGRALPWVDPDLFAELMLSWDIRSYRWALTRPGPVFFDHAVPGVPGFLRLAGRPVPAHMEAAVATFRYRTTVYVAPPWREIYRRDRERRQSFAEAERTHDILVEAYRGYGYHPVELPRCPPADRARFVLRDAPIGPARVLRCSLARIVQALGRHAGSE